MNYKSHNAQKCMFELQIETSVSDIVFVTNTSLMIICDYDNGFHRQLQI